jgi:hypothetical protein
MPTFPFRRASLAASLTLASWPALAVYTDVSLPGMDPGQIASGTVTLPDGRTLPFVTREECERDRKEDEQCDRSGAFFIRTDAALERGTRVRIRFVDTDGASHSIEGEVTPAGIRVASLGGAPGGGYFELMAGYGEVDLPERSGGLGVQLSQTIGNERVLAFSPRTLEGESATLRFAPRWTVSPFGRPLTPVVSFWWTNGDGTERGRAPAGPDSTGFVYPRDTAQGSPGLSLGPSEIDVLIANDFEVIGASIGAGRNFGPDDDYFCNAVIGVEQAIQRMQGDLRVAAFTGPLEVSANNRQKLQSDRLMLTYRIGRNFRANEVVTVSPYLVADVGYQETELTGQWRSIANPLPPTSPERDLRFDYDESESGFAYGGGAGLTVDFKISKSFSLGFGGEYRYLADGAGRAANRGTPLQDPTHVEIDDEEELVVFGKIRTTFGF